MMCRYLSPSGEDEDRVHLVLDCLSRACDYKRRRARHCEHQGNGRPGKWKGIKLPLILSFLSLVKLTATELATGRKTTTSLDRTNNNYLHTKGTRCTGRGERTREGKEAHYMPMIYIILWPLKNARSLSRLSLSLSLSLLGRSSWLRRLGRVAFGVNFRAIPPFAVRRFHERESIVMRETRSADACREARFTRFEWHCSDCLCVTLWLTSHSPMGAPVRAAQPAARWCKKSD